MKKKEKNQSLNEVRPIKWMIISHETKSVIFEARTVGEAIAFMRGHQGGVLCKVLSGFHTS